MTARVEWLTVGGPRDPWRRLGLHVDGDGEVSLFGPGLRLVEGDGRGILGWALSSVDGGVSDVDGLPTESVSARPPVLVEHPIGAIGLDHVVVVTDALKRTSTALTEATGAPLKRIREAGELRQGFHRIGPLIVEVVERAGLPEGPSSFWGLVLNVEDLDLAVERLGPELISEARPAVQPGRSIATVRPEADLGLPVALMTP